MKNQYLGDLGDYGKYGLLRYLAEQGVRIGINWYLTEDDSSTDGKFKDYLDREIAGWMPDPETDMVDVRYNGIGFASEAVRIRDGPDIGSEILAVLPADGIVHVSGTERVLTAGCGSMSCIRKAAVCRQTLARSAVVRTVISLPHTSLPA